MTKRAPMRVLLAAALVAGFGGAAAAQTPDLKLDGVIYAQYGYLLSDSANDGNGFEVTRTYVNVRGTFPHGIGTRVTTDIYRNDDGSLDARLKYAYATWTPEESPLTFKFGQIHTPWLDWEEALWDYRMQGTMPLDRAGYLTSSDIGFGIDGSWNQHAFDFQAAVVNGEGYHAPETGKGKDVEARASWRLLRTDDMGKTGGLRITGYGQLGSRTGGGARDRWVGELSYRSSMLTLAGEYGLTRDELGGVDVDGNVVSGYGVLRLPESPLEVIARVDFVDPNTDADDDARTVFIGGVSYRLAPNVRLLLDLDHSTYQMDPLPPAVEAGRSRALFQTEFTF